MANPADTSVTWRIKADRSSDWTRRLKARVAAETQTFVNNVLQTAQSTVRVQTGATRDSGRIVQVDEQVWAVRFGGAAAYLEFGTAKMPAYPFLRPAVTVNQTAYLARLAITTQGRVRPAISNLADAQYH